MRYTKALRDSVPIKAIDAFKRRALSPTGGSYNGRKPTLRTANAVLALASGSGIETLTDGATFTRIFTHNNIKQCVENGAGDYAIGCGFLKLAPDSVPLAEKFILRPGAAQANLLLSGKII